MKTMFVTSGLCLYVIGAFVSTCSAQTARPKQTQFDSECLTAHNEYRALHGSPPLVLNSTISAFSQKWADHLLLTDTFKHRPNNTYGENIFYSWSSDRNATADGNEAVDDWYSEIEDYTYGSNFSIGSAHFTQVIWRNSKQLGIGWASKNGTNIVVCNYSPPGNYEGKFDENVLPPTNISTPLNNDTL